MSGHSKWHSIRHKKALIDAKRGKIFTKLAREIWVASRLAGDNPQNNYRLRLAMEKAKSANMPNNKIQNAIQKGSGNLKNQKTRYEDILYEAYGPESVAFLIEVLSDNRNRIVSEIRQIFFRYGGSLAESGSVLWMFVKVGLILINLHPNSNEKISENIEALEENLLNEICEFNLVDFKQDQHQFIIYSHLNDFEKLKKNLNSKFHIEKSEILYIPKNSVQVNDNKKNKLFDLYEHLDENLDIQSIYWNLNI